MTFFMIKGDQSSKGKQQKKKVKKKEGKHFLFSQS